MKIELRLWAWQTKEVSRRCYLVEGMVVATIPLTWTALGETLDQGLSGQMMETRSVLLPHGGITFGAIVGLWRKLVEWYASTMSMTASLSGVMEQGLSDTRDKMNSHRVRHCLSLWWHRWQGL
jgi:hypothetical protein